MTEKEMRSQLKFYWYILLFIGLVCFIVFSIIAISEKFEKEGAWEATISVFSLLGVLLTAGGVFAGTVAILSYFSVKEKLDKAESELDKIRDIQQRYEFAENNIKGLENYQLAVEELNKNFSEIEKEKFYEMAKNILAAKNPDYHIKIKANAILLEETATEAYKGKNFSDAIKYYEELVDLWKLLFLYDKKNNVENYLLAIFRLATSISQANSKNKYEKASELYELLIIKANEFGIKSDVVSSSYNNWGVLLRNEAILINKDNLKEAKALFQQAKYKYIEAIKIKPDYQKTYNNLKIALSKLDDFLDKEKKQDYWQQVQEEIMSLPDSEPKQDMLKFIEKQISSAKEKP